MDEYLALIAALEETGIPFAEDGWDSQPEMPYGVYAIDSDAGALWAEDRLISQGLQGTVDLFTGLGAARIDRKVIEDALAQSGLSYRFKFQRYEAGSGSPSQSRRYSGGDRLMHYQWEFDVMDDREE